MSFVSQPLNSNTLANPNTPFYGVGASGAVSQIVAGSNVTVTPSSGVGVVTVNSLGAVTQLLAGTNISLSPSTGVGAVTINSSGSGGVATVAGTANQIASAGTTAVTLSLLPPVATPGTDVVYANPKSLTVDALGRVVAATAGASSSTIFPNVIYSSGSAFPIYPGTYAYSGATVTPVTYPLVCPSAGGATTSAGSLFGVALSNSTVFPAIGDFEGLITFNFIGGSGYTVQGATGANVLIGFVLQDVYQQSGTGTQFTYTNSTIPFSLPATYSAYSPANGCITIPYKWKAQTTAVSPSTVPNSNWCGLRVGIIVAGATSITFAANTDIGLSFNVTANGAPSSWFYGPA